MTETTFILTGPPRTKKTHSQIVMRGRPRLLPSPQFREWNALVQPQLAVFRAKAPGGLLPFKVPVNCRALFFRHAKVGDATGFYQALADALQEGGIVENDKLIETWDGSRMLKDKDNPRIIVTIEALP